MAGSTYSTNLKLELMTTGENSGTWGDVTNTNLGTALEQAVVGYGNPDYVSDANLTISITNSNASQAARALVLNVTSTFGSLTATRELVVPTIQKQYIVQNNTSGGQSITVKTSAGTGITVPNGRKAHLYVDGTNVIQMFDFVDINGGAIDGTTIGASSASTGAFTTLNASGATTLDGNVTLGNASGDTVTVTGTIASNLLFTDNTYDIGASGATRPRNLYLAGAATIGGNLSVGGTLTLTGGLTLNGNVTVGDSAADTLTINSTVTCNLIFTDNTYDIGASGATRPRNLFIAGNITAGGSQTLTGSLTVDSTTDSSSTTTGSIQTDGGLGVAKALYVGTTANIAGAVTLSGGTANGVMYLNGSKQITTGSELTFDGNGLSVGTTGHSYKFMVSDAGAVGFEVGPGTTYVAGRVLLQSYNRSGAAYSGFDYSASDHKFQLAGSLAMSLVSTGQLGVGLVPTNNSYLIQSNSGISAGTSVVAQGTLQSYTGAGVFLSYESTYGRLEAYDYGGTGYKNIAIAPNGGYVGAGTSTPATKLDVRGTSASVASTIQIVGNTVSTLLLGQNASGGVIRGQGGSDALAFWVGGSADTAASGSGSEVGRFTSAGNFGVGNTVQSNVNYQFGSNLIDGFGAITSCTIGKRLGVSSYADSPILTLGYYSSAYGMDLWVGTTGLSPGYIDIRNNEALIFRKNTYAGSATETMRISSTSSLLLGTSSGSGAKMDIAFSTTQTGLVIAPTSFVYPTYSLLTTNGVIGTVKSGSNSVRLIDIRAQEQTATANGQVIGGYFQIDNPNAAVNINGGQIGVYGLVNGVNNYTVGHQYGVLGRSGSGGTYGVGVMAQLGSEQSLGVRAALVAATDGSGDPIAIFQNGSGEQARFNAASGLSIGTTGITGTRLNVVGGANMTYWSGGNTSTNITSGTPDQFLFNINDSTVGNYFQFRFTNNGGGTMFSMGAQTTSSSANFNNGKFFIDGGIRSTPQVFIVDSSTEYTYCGYSSSNGSYRLQVNGQIFATSSTIATSDGRYKENVQDLTGALDLVKALRPVSFNWKKHNIHNFNTEDTTVGFIAQEVQQAMADKPYLNSFIKVNKCTSFDEVEQKDCDEEFMGFAETNMVAILTKALQELNAKFDAYVASHP